MADETTPTKGKRDAQSFDTTGPTSAKGDEGPLSQQAQAEQSLTDEDKPVIIKTVLSDLNTDHDKATSATIVNAWDGEEVEAENGLPYEGVSANWVKLQTKD